MSEEEVAAERPEARSSLEARANAVALALAEAAQVAKDASERQTISLATMRAQALAERIEVATTVRGELLQRSVNVSDIGEGHRRSAGAARTALRRAIPAFRDPEVALSPRLNGESVQGGLTSAEKLAKSLEKQLNEAVNDYRLNNWPADLADPIPDLPNKGLAAVKLLGIQRRLRSEVSSRPVEELVALVDQFDADVKTWNDGRPALGTAFAQLPQAIQDFMSAAMSEEGARWELVTDEVRTWLDQDGSAASCTVRLQRD